MFRSHLYGAATLAVALVVGGSVPAGAAVDDPCYWTSCPVGLLQVTDGDTIMTDAGSVRIIGIDAPELDECGGPESRSNLSRLLAGSAVAIYADTNQPDRDRYGRLLRHVTFDGAFAGEQQLLDDHAVARYDSLDGYGTHDNESRYRAIPTSPPRCQPLAGPGDETGVGDDEDRRDRDPAKHRAKKGLNKKQQRRAVYRYWRRNYRSFMSWSSFRRSSDYRRIRRYARSGLLTKNGRFKVGSHSGYTGPRCYAPGGTSWRPC